MEAYHIIKGVEQLEAENKALKYERELLKTEVRAFRNDISALEEQLREAKDLNKTIKDKEALEVLVNSIHRSIKDAGFCNEDDQY